MSRKSSEANAQYMREYRARQRAEKGAAESTAASVPKKRPAARPPASRSARRHRDAVARMLRVTGLLHVPEEAPLVQLVKDLAYDLDAGGGNDVYAKYLSALKDVRRVLTYSARPSSSADPAPPASPDRSEEESADTEAAPVNSLADFRKQRGIG